jgi:hypothetical protein
MMPTTVLKSWSDRIHIKVQITKSRRLWIVDSDRGNDHEQDSEGIMRENEPRRIMFNGRWVTMRAMESGNLTMTPWRMGKPRQIVFPAAWFLPFPLAAVTDQRPQFSAEMLSSSDTPLKCIKIFLAAGVAA